MFLVAASAIFAAALTSTTSTSGSGRDESGYGVTQWGWRVYDFENVAGSLPQCARHGWSQTSDPVESTGYDCDTDDKRFDHDGPPPSASATRQVTKDAA